MFARSSTLIALLGSVVVSNGVLGQQTPDSQIPDIVSKIKEEGLERSQVMDTVSFLTDVYGPRLTASPKTKIAGEWAKQRLTDWGLEQSHLESWGPFGRGWTLETFTANMVEPSFSSLIGYPKAWSPSTPKTIRGVPILLEVSTPEDFEKYRGKLLRSIVMISPPREVKALFDAPATRQTDEALLTLANADAPAARGGPGRRRPNGNNGTAPQPAASKDGAAPTQPAPPAQPEGRSAMQLQADKWQFVYSEGAAVVLEPGQGNGGTVFVAGATLPRKPEATGQTPSDGREGRGRPGGARMQPWAPEATDIIPQVVLSVEHYNRLARMLQRDTKPVLEIDIGSQYYSEDLNSFNIIAEIPGTDLKDEIVMLGAHFDSWHAGTGATDNGVGCAVAMEAVRILKAVGAQPRRTIRIGLWTGEEQGLYGSKAYVADHFGKAIPREGNEGRAQYETKPEYEKLSAYYNLDNGTGKIRGIYLQGNEAVRSTFRSWLSPFTDMGASTITLSNTGGTDHLSFDGIGLPGFQFIQDPVEYDTRTHHSSMDVYERIQPDDAKQASIIMATFAYQTAMLNEKLPRKPLNGDIVPSPTVVPAVGAAASTVTEVTPATATDSPKASDAVPATQSTGAEK